MVQLVSMNYNGFFGNFTAASASTGTQIQIESETDREKHPNIFVGNKSVSRKWEPRSSSMANP